MKLSASVLAPVSLGLFVFSMGGTKEEIVRLQSDVLQLSNQIRMLQKGNDETGSVFQSLLEQLNDQVAQMNLATDELHRTIQDQKTDVFNLVTSIRSEVQNLSVKLDDTNNRLTALQKNQEEQQVRMQSLRTAPAAAEGRIQPDQAYAAAYNDFIIGNYDLAIAGFQDLLDSHPDSDYSDNALYYSGICSQEQQRYEQAIQAFDQVINLYPKGDKTAAAYFKKAQVFQHLQKNTDAIDTFRQLIEVYPETQEAVQAQRELERMGV
jgi:tol-pal system protein YbgF